ncbi:MAG: 8-oxoguanine DNA glycosylase [Clostridia bacterium]|nr:8-oxoguanine DNA glycosylase [Clostridia bacterium]
MKEQNLIIDKVDAFTLRDIFDCGQCFRWNMEQNGSYTGIVKNGVLNVNCDDNKIYFNGILDCDIQDFVYKYFDLERNYNDIKKTFAKIDEYMKESVKYGEGIRILNQDLWETIISYIISANNNIPRIKGIIERLSAKYGTKVIFNNKEYYLFPTPYQLKDVTVSEYRALGLGFRDIRLYETTQMILNKEFNLDDVYKMDTPTAKENLEKLSGVGSKVADCILLFSDLKRFDSFPIDVWVRRVMNDLYVKSEDEKKVSNKVINEIAYNKFGDLAGLAQQYLYHWRRTFENQSNKKI